MGFREYGSAGRAVLVVAEGCALASDFVISSPADLT